MKELTFDLIILAVHNTAQGIIHTWPMILTYQASYSYHVNNQITFQYAYYAIFFFGIGRLLSSYLSEVYFLRLGFKLGLAGSVAIQLLCLYYFIYASTITQLYFQYIILGFNFILINTAGNLFICEKYGRSQMTSIQYFNFLKMRWALVLSVIVKVIMNPDNKPMEVEAPDGSRYYSKDVADNFALFSIFANSPVTKTKALR